MSRDTMNAPFGMRRRATAEQASGRGFLLVLFGVFAAIMLAALLVGLQGYRAIVDEKDTVDEQRLAYGSLVNTVKAFDAIGAFRLNEYEGNDALLMVQRTTGGTYFMLLYVHDGMLMQQYSVAAPNGPEFSPESAHPLFETNTFAVSYQDGLLTLATDAASPQVRLTCPQPMLDRETALRAAAASEAGDA